uniref:Uncharacterized protein n=1 Tax=Cucumis melo TaxID=3656 RepID=A0A9I9E3W1_CUCME
MGSTVIDFSRRATAAVIRGQHTRDAGGCFVERRRAAVAVIRGQHTR